MFCLEISLNSEKIILNCHFLKTNNGVDSLDIAKNYKNVIISYKPNPYYLENADIEPSFEHYPHFLSYGKGDVLVFLHRLSIDLCRLTKKTSVLF